MATVRWLDGRTEPGWHDDGSHHFNIAGQGYAVDYCEFTHYMTYIRDDIGRMIGRRLLTTDEAEGLVWSYRKWTDPREVYAAMALARHDYGDHHRQRWYALRDLAIATRDIRRRRPRCPICKHRLVAFDSQPERLAFFTIIGHRHFFRLPRTDDPRMRRWHMLWFQDNLLMSKDMEMHLTWYYRENPAQVCGSACEATRYSRWWGVLNERLRQKDKERNRYRKETQWLKTAKTELRNVRQFLHQGASPSQDAASKPASTSHAS